MTVAPAITTQREALQLGFSTAFAPSPGKRPLRFPGIHLRFETDLLLVESGVQLFAILRWARACIVGAQVNFLRINLALEALDVVQRVPGIIPRILFANEIQDSDFQTLKTIRGCVPNKLLPGEYGDYLALDIDEVGIIKNWLDNPELSEFE